MFNSTSRTLASCCTRPITAKTSRPSATATLTIFAFTNRSSTRSPCSRTNSLRFTQENEKRTVGHANVANHQIADHQGRLAFNTKSLSLSRLAVFLLSYDDIFANGCRNLSLGDNWLAQPLENTWMGCTPSSVANGSVQIRLYSRSSKEPRIERSSLLPFVVPTSYQTGDFRGQFFSQSPREDASAAPTHEVDGCFSVLTQSALCHCSSQNFNGRSLQRIASHPG